MYNVFSQKKSLGAFLLILLIFLLGLGGHHLDLSRVLQMTLVFLLVVGGGVDLNLGGGEGYREPLVQSRRPRSWGRAKSKSTGPKARVPASGRSSGSGPWWRPPPLRNIHPPAACSLKPQQPKRLEQPEMAAPPLPRPLSFATLPPPHQAFFKGVTELEKRWGLTPGPFLPLVGWGTLGLQEGRARDAGVADAHVSLSVARAPSSWGGAIPYGAGSSLKAPGGKEVQPPATKKNTAYWSSHYLTTPSSGSMGGTPGKGRLWT